MERDYRPIADYAAIGDCHGGALVASNGDIDWCALGRFDADPVFCRLLDTGRGGHLSVRPRGAAGASRAYLQGTNILRTELHTAGGRVALTDFMPVGRSPHAGANDYVTLSAPHCLIRRIEGLEGTVDADIAYCPSVDFAKRTPELRAAPAAIHLVGGGPVLYSDCTLIPRDGKAHGRITLRAGEHRYLALAAGDGAFDAAHVEALQRITAAFWREWIGYCRYRGPYSDRVRRSALALKLNAQHAGLRRCTTTLSRKTNPAAIRNGCCRRASSPTPRRSSPGRGGIKACGSRRRPRRSLDAATTTG